MEGTNDGIPSLILTKNNYSQWKLRTCCDLEYKNLEDVVYGQDLGPSAEDLALASQNEATATDKGAVKAAIARANKYKTQEIRARRILISTIDADNINLIAACKTAREIWSRLKLEYAARGTENRESLLSEYYSCKMEGRSTLSEYVAKVDEIALKLGSFGHHLSDETVMIKIVSGLPPEYSAFQRAWDLIPSQFRSRNLLLLNLKKEEKNLRESGAVSEALIAKSSSNKNRGKSNQAKKKGACKWCNQPGHWWKECPTRPKDKLPEGVKPRTERADKGNDDHKERVLCARSEEIRGGKDWILDSGASSHMTSQFDRLNGYHKLVEPMPIRVGNNEILYAVGAGHINAVADLGNKKQKIKLERVLYVPKISDNLFSLGAADEKGVSVTFDSGRVYLKNSDGEIIITGVKATARLYKLNLEVPVIANIARSERTLTELHEVLGHADTRMIQQMARQSHAVGMKVVEAARTAPTNCGECQVGNCHQASHGTSKSEKATDILHRIHESV